MGQLTLESIPSGRRMIQMSRPGSKTTCTIGTLTLEEMSISPGQDEKSHPAIETVLRSSPSQIEFKATILTKNPIAPLFEIGKIMPPEIQSIFPETSGQTFVLYKKHPGRGKEFEWRFTYIEDLSIRK